MFRDPAALVKVVTKNSPFIHHFVFSMQIAVDMFTLLKHIYTSNFNSTLL